MAGKSSFCEDAVDGRLNAIDHRPEARRSISGQTHRRGPRGRLTRRDLFCTWKRESQGGRRMNCPWGLCQTTILLRSLWQWGGEQKQIGNTPRDLLSRPPIRRKPEARGGKRRLRWTSPPTVLVPLGFCTSKFHRAGQSRARQDTSFKKNPKVIVASSENVVVKAHEELKGRRGRGALSGVFEFSLFFGGSRRCLSLSITT
jgi:hypothetical protein